MKELKIEICVGANQELVEITQADMGLNQLYNKVDEITKAVKELGADSYTAHLEYEDGSSVSITLSEEDKDVDS